MLWRPVTYGEQMFLLLHRDLGQGVEIAHQDHAMDYLVDRHRFGEFLQLTVSLEVFLRALRTARELYREAPDAPQKEYGRAMRRDIELPATLASNDLFCESAKHAARIAEEERRVEALERNVRREGRNQCYLCGETLIEKPKTEREERLKPTVDHLWPLSLGGESLEENMLPACHDCNNKRDKAVTWAWGPVQSTYGALTATRTQPHHSLRIALAIGRLMLAAAPSGKRRMVRSLKESALHIWPAIPRTTVPVGRPHTFFEYFGTLEV